jgi:hypothetical protein
MRKRVSNNSFKKDVFLPCYFDIIIDNEGNVRIEPWDELLENIFRKSKTYRKSVKIYRYCG